MEESGNSLVEKRPQHSETETETFPLGHRMTQLAPSFLHFPFPSFTYL